MRRATVHERSAARAVQPTLACFVEPSIARLKRRLRAGGAAEAGLRAVVRGDAEMAEHETGDVLQRPLLADLVGPRIEAAEQNGPSESPASSEPWLPPGQCVTPPQSTNS